MLFADLAVFERSIILKYMYEIVMAATSHRTMAAKKFWPSLS
jgi:hypothetical protein